MQNEPRSSARTSYVLMLESMACLGHNTQMLSACFTSNTSSSFENLRLVIPPRSVWPGASWWRCVQVHSFGIYSSSLRWLSIRFRDSTTALQRARRFFILTRSMRMQRGDVTHIWKRRCPTYKRTTSLEVSFPPQLCLDNQLGLLHLPRVHSLGYLHILQTPTALPMSRRRRRLHQYLSTIASCLEFSTPSWEGFWEIIWLQVRPFPD